MSTQHRQKRSGCELLVLRGAESEGVYGESEGERDGSLSQYEAWGRSIERTFRARHEKRMNTPGRPPPDGFRVREPPTRKGLGLDESGVALPHGVMMADIGYETIRRGTPRWGGDPCARRGREATAPTVPVSDMAIWMLGRDEAGESVCVWVHGVAPYFHVGVSHPDARLPEAAARQYALELEAYLKHRCGCVTGRGPAPRVIGVRPVKRRWFYGYRPDPTHDAKTPRFSPQTGEGEPQPWAGDTTQASDWYLKVMVGAPYDINKMRGWCTEWAEAQSRTAAAPKRDASSLPTVEGHRPWTLPTIRCTSTISAPVSLVVFEANVEFVLRFMIDRGLVGHGWLTIDPKAGPDRGVLAHYGPGGVEGMYAAGRRTGCRHEYVIDGSFFEMAEAAMDGASLGASSGDRWAAAGSVLHPAIPRPFAMRVVAREASLQHFAEGDRPPSAPALADRSEAQRRADETTDRWLENLRAATAPLTVMSFDIECCNRKGSFPDPLDPESQVVNLAARVYRLDRVEVYEKRRMAVRRYRELIEKRRAAMQRVSDASGGTGTVSDASGGTGTVSDASGGAGGEDGGGATEEEEAARRDLAALAAEDGLDAARIEVERCKWPPPMDAVVMGLGERTGMVRGGMDGYPVAAMSFSDERELFVAFAKLIQVWDPDVIEGYNSVAFDMAYMLRRAEALDVEQVFWELGRIRGQLSKPREESFGNKARGKSSVWRAHIPGRVQFDLYVCCSSDMGYKPRSFRLDDVARDLLQEGKTGLKYAQIPEKHWGTAETRHELDEYCDADAALPFKLERERTYLLRYVELARVTGVPMSFLLTKGQQVLVFTQLLRKARELGYAVPWLPVVEPERDATEARTVKAYQGAVVIDPISGFYRQPVVVLDYTSLYPMSMCSQNLDYTTHVTDSLASAAARDYHNRVSPDYDRRELAADPCHDGDLSVRAHERQWGWKVAPVHSKTRVDPVFVREDVRVGIVPQILLALLAARARVKKEMKRWPKGSPMYRVLDARQMALKVCCNSVYGFTGAPVGRQPDLDISGATTGYGRAALYFAKRLGDLLLPGDNETVYGDTDSVMIVVRDIPPEVCVPRPGEPYSAEALAAIKLACERGEILADEVNKRLLKPMNLEEEKVYCPFLLLGKKKYMTLMWMNAKEPFGVDAKGIEMVRRDNPQIVGMTCERFAELLMGNGGVDPATGRRVALYPDIEVGKALLTEMHRRMLSARNEEAGEGLPLSAYVITGKFGKPIEEYKDKPPHVTLAARMRERDPGSAPQLGNRVPYVVVTPDCTQAARVHHKTSERVNERSEDPEWAAEHGMRVDTVYYARKKFEPPFRRMLAPVLAAHELAHADPPNPGMATRQKRRYRHEPAKYEEWHKDKRQEVAENVVRRAIFAENYHARKVRKIRSTDTPLGSFLTGGRIEPPTLVPITTTTTTTTAPTSGPEAREGGELRRKGERDSDGDAVMEEALSDEDDDGVIDVDEEVDEDARVELQAILDDAVAVARQKVAERRQKGGTETERTAVVRQGRMKSFLARAPDPQSSTRDVVAEARARWAVERQKNPVPRPRGRKRKKASPGQAGIRQFFTPSPSLPCGEY